MLQERAHAGLHEYVASLLPAGGGMSILDIGCGTGAWLHRIRARGSRMVGIDYVQPEPLEGMDLRRFDINTDSYETLGKFDLVSCIEVIEHIENVGKLLDLIKGTLAANGLCVITTPNIESRRARTRAFLKGKIPAFDENSDPTHLMPILRDSMHKMLQRREMVISEIRQFPPRPGESKAFGLPIQLVSRILPLPNKLYGDTVVYLIKHAGN